MKSIIIMLFSMMLGIALFFNLLVGEDSIRDNASDVFQVQISTMKTIP